MNAPTTYFLTPYDLINVEVNGSIQVWGNSDNDFVGFYFGYEDSLNYLHFKWSRREVGVTLTTGRMEFDPGTKWGEHTSGL